MTDHEVQNLAYRYTKEELASMYIKAARQHPISDFYRWVADQINLQAGTSRFGVRDPHIYENGVATLRAVHNALEQYFREE